MSTDLQTAIITTLLSIFAGILGYAFREYRNRAKPFIAVTEIEGGNWERKTQVDIPDSVVVSTKSSFSIRELFSPDSLVEVDRTRRDAKSLVEDAKGYLLLVDKVIEAAHYKDQISLQNSLFKVLERASYEDWLLNLLYKHGVSSVNPNESLPVVIQTFSSSEDDGCVWINFPGAPMKFGKRFDKIPILKGKCQPFIQLIERMDVDGLGTFFEDFKKKMENEASIAKEVFPIVDGILDDNSSWMIEMYIANLGKTAFLISKNGELHVEDETGAKYNEKCDLVLITKKDDGSKNRSKAISPLVVGGESDTMIAFVTSSSQGKMKRGKGFRDTFTSGSARCWIEFNIEKVGFMRNKKITTPKVPFKGE